MKPLQYVIIGAAALAAAAAGRALSARRRSTTSARATTAFDERWAGCDFTDGGFRSEEAKRIPLYAGIVEEQADRFGVDGDLVLGTIHVESNFNPKARSSVGAVGLMQLMPKTSAGIASRLGIQDRPEDPVANITMGTSLISVLLQQFDDNEQLAMASYFAGSKNVRDALASGGLTEKQRSYAHAVAAAKARFGRLRSSCTRVA
jgi:soluble lytic murein transglycosylase-like protein